MHLVIFMYAVFAVVWASRTETDRALVLERQSGLVKGKTLHALRHDLSAAFNLSGLYIVMCCFLKCG